MLFPGPSPKNFRGTVSISEATNVAARLERCLSCGGDIPCRVAGTHGVSDGARGEVGDVMIDGNMHAMV